MSVEIDWENICGDSSVNDGLTDFLNSRLQEFELPSYVNMLKVTNFNLGSIPPRIVIKQMDDPLDEFYSFLMQQGDITEESATERETDVQLLVEIDYKGDMSIELTAELVLNYPSPQFMTLPVKLRISEIGIHCLCLIAYMKQQMFISFLCDVSDPLLEANKLQVDPNGPNFMGKRAIERISLIRNIEIHTELGAQEQGEGSVLRSVGKLQDFLIDMLRNIIRKEVAWPSWINLDFTPEESDSEDEATDELVSETHGDSSEDLPSSPKSKYSDKPLNIRTASTASLFDRSSTSSQ